MRTSMRRGRLPSLKSLGVFLLLFATFAAFALLYVWHLGKTLRAEACKTLMEISSQSVTALHNQIEGDLQTLRNLADFIGGTEDLSFESNLPILQEISDKNGFKRMGIILPDGNVHTTDDVVDNLADRNYFQRAMLGESVVSDTLSERFGSGAIHVYAAPIPCRGEIAGVIFATHDEKSYNDSLAVSTFEGRGASLVVQKDGLLIAQSEEAGHALATESIETARFAAGYSLDQVREDMQAGLSGTVVYALNGVQKYLSYTPLSINGWSLCTVVPSAVVMEKTHYLLSSTLVIGAGISLFFSALLFYSIHLHKKSRRALYELAYTDPLTGTVNLNRLKVDGVRLLEKRSPHLYALVQFDVEKFKYINDMYGYEAGNRILCAISDAARETVREYELFARVANDDFAMLLRCEDGREALSGRLLALASRIGSCVGANESSGLQIKIVLSFGVYLLPCRPVGEAELIGALDKANIARETVKGRHESSVAFYENELRNRIIEEKDLENHMHAALRNGEFRMFLQPKYDLVTHRIAGAEALVRWEHPKKGLLQPGTFIELFEKNGFIVQIDLFMFEEVCKVLRRWIDDGVAVPVSVNLSRAHLCQTRFIDQFDAIAGRYGVDRGLIEIELTESYFFEDVDGLLHTMQRLRQLGFLLSMDDFGTGYSSLNLLKDLPVDILKLDRAFFQQFQKREGGERTKKVIAGVVTLAKSIDMRIVCEGVETEEQADFLRKIGCDLAQGYLFARPMPAADFEGLLKENPSLSRWTT